MKYKVGDKVFFDRYGDFQECEVIGLLEKTTRYRVKYIFKAYNGMNTDERMMPEGKLFLSINECIDSEISILKKQQEYIQKQIDALNSKRIK